MPSKSWASLGATAAVCAAVALWPGIPAQAQQAQQASPPATAPTATGNATGLVNQIEMLKDQNRQLLGQVEQLQHRVGQLQQIGKEQYIALNTRIKKLEAAASKAAAVERTRGKAAAKAEASNKAKTKTAASPPASKAHDKTAAKKPQDHKPAAPSSTPAAPAASASAPASAASTETAADTATQQAYDKAFDALRAGNFDASKQQFKAFVQQYQHAKLTPNAWYWLGESYYVTQDYSHALGAFERVIKDFPDSNKAPGSLLKKGYSQYNLHKTDAATATLKQVVAQYPDSSVAKLATQRLQDIQLQQQLQ